MDVLMVANHVIDMDVVVVPGSVFTMLGRDRLELKQFLEFV